MKFRIGLAACAAITGFGAAHAANYVESAVETSTALVHLPDTVPQTVSVRTCPACLAKELTANAETRYFVGKTAVALDVLRKAAAQTNTHVYVFYDAKQKVITRIRLDAVLDPASVPAATPGNKRRGN